MKAIVYERYGPPEVLHLKEVHTPVPKDNEVLIKIHATTVTAGDCEVRSFTFAPLVWWFVRIVMGVFRPRKKILGQELAGEVVALGKDVTSYKIGDRVFAPATINFGGYAEYICLPDTAPISTIPKNISFEEAATIPVGGFNALHFLRKADLKPGQSLLIVGSGGSIGTAAVQLAKNMGAEVTSIDSTDKLDMLKAIGADHVIDYTKEDFTKQGRSYDVILDVVCRTPFSAGIKCLNPMGTYLVTNPNKLSTLLKGLWISKTSDLNVVFAFADYIQKDLEYLKDLMEAGTLKAVIDKRYPLEEIPEAHRYVEQELKKGSVVITVNQDG